MKAKSILTQENRLTKTAVLKKAEKFKQLYMRRSKKRPGRRPNKEFFIFFAAYSLFKEKYPERKEIHGSLSSWLYENFSQYDRDDNRDDKGISLDFKKLYEWMGRRPFKEMQWERNWEDLRIAQKISYKIKDKGMIKQREDVMRPYNISKKELEDLTGFVLSQNSYNKKESNRFVFNRPGK